MLSILQGVALVGATLHPFDGSGPRPGTLLMEEGILTLLPAEALPPEGFEIVDLAGAHVIPGLVDAAAAHYPEHDALYLAAGVTTVRDTGSELALGLASRRPSSRDAVPGPRLWFGGPMMTAQTVPMGVHWPIIAGDPAGAASQVEGLVQELSRAKEVLDGLVCDQNLAVDSWEAVLEAGLASGLRLWGPLPRGATLERALELGQHAILGVDSVLGTHPDDLPVARRTQVIEQLADHGAQFIPLLGIVERALRPHPAQAPELSLLNPDLEGVWLQEQARWSRDVQGEFAQNLRRVALAQGEFVRDLLSAGARVLPGSGAPAPWLLPGRALIEELERWQGAGVPAELCVRAATRHAQQALEGLDTLAGTLQDGAPADLVVLAEDPTKDVEHLRDPIGVAVRGQWIPASGLRERLMALGERQTQVRVAQERPMVVPAPPIPEGAKLLLSGQAETRSGGRRLGTEHFSVARLEDGARLYACRSVSLGTARSGAQETLFSMTVRGGQLEGFELQVRDVTSERVLTTRGQWIPETQKMQVERRLDDVFIANDPITELPILADVSPSLTAIVLAQHAPAGTSPALYFQGATSEPRVQPYEVEVTPNGLLRVRTQGGGLLLGVDEQGVPVAHTRLLGGTRTDLVVLSSTTHGGSGLPPVPARIARLEGAPPK